MNFYEILKNYEERRKELLDHNSNLTGLVLREKEKQADSYLSAIKDKFFRRRCEQESEPGGFETARHKLRYVQRAW